MKVLEYDKSIIYRSITRKQLENGIATEPMPGGWLNGHWPKNQIQR